MSELYIYQNARRNKKKYMACIFIYCICKDQSLVSRSENPGQQRFGILVSPRMNYIPTKDGSYLACDSAVVGTEWSGHIRTRTFERTALFLVTLLLALIIAIQIRHR